MQVITSVISEKHDKVLGLSFNSPFLLALVFLVTSSTGLGISDIDKDHYAMYPYCGSRRPKDPTTEGATQAKSRSINSEDSKEDYRWTALLLRENTGPKSGKVRNTYCSGSIITDRAILTAGHCICTKEDNAKDALLCTINPLKSRNEISSDNEIRIYAGDERRFQMINGMNYEWKVKEAYVMEGSSEKLWDKIDVGIALIRDGLPTAKRLFDRLSLEVTSKLRVAKRVPVCLAAMSYDVKTKTLLGAGWGYEYEQSQSTLPIYSTCMSSQAGPETWRFQNCKIGGSYAIGDVKGDVCNKIQPPPEYDKDKCEKYFDQAGLNEEKEDRPNSPNPLKLTAKVADIDVMYIDKGKEGSKDIEYTCYQPKNFKKHGWCYLEKRDFISLSPKPWGICSPSCKYVKTGVTSVDGDHQKEWKLTVNSNANNFCSTIDYWDPQYMICLKSKLPQTRTVTFKRKKNRINVPDNKRNPIDWKRPDFQKDENSGGKINGYRVPCTADSGSGQVVLTSISPNSLKDSRYVLAAVFTARAHSSFTDDNDKKEYNVPCGSYAYDIEGILKAEAIAQITSWPNIFNWIKDKAGIKQPSS